MLTCGERGVRRDYGNCLWKFLSDRHLRSLRLLPTPDEEGIETRPLMPVPSRTQSSLCCFRPLMKKGLRRDMHLLASLPSDRNALLPTPDEEGIETPALPLQSQDQSSELFPTPDEEGIRDLTELSAICSQMTPCCFRPLMKKGLRSV